MHYKKLLEQHSTKWIQIDGYEIETVRSFLDYLGKPDEGMYVFHIGGTSGKGSTSTILSNFLASQGLKVGLFVSPHIETVKERIQLNNKNISEDYMQKYVERVVHMYQKFRSMKESRELTYFEIVFVAALLYFRDQGAVVAVIEVGLGGRLDPTNVLFGNTCVLTNIGLDHTQYLGDTIEKIAYEKVQIVKSGSILVTGVQQESAKRIIKNWTSGKAVEEFWFGNEINLFGIKLGNSRTGFELKIKNLLERKFLVSLLGRHQVENAALSLTTFVSYMQKQNKEINWKQLDRALANVKIPGRIEIVSKRPLVILDGAHNEDKFKALVATLKNNSKSIVLLMALKNDKDSARIFEQLAGLRHKIKKVVLTKFGANQDLWVNSFDPEELLTQLTTSLPGIPIETEENPQMAYDNLKKELDNDEMLLVTGSFYLLASITAR